MQTFSRLAGHRPRSDARFSRIIGDKIVFRYDRFAKKLVKEGKLIEQWIAYPEEHDIDLDAGTCLFNVRYFAADDENDDEDMGDQYDEQLDIKDVGKLYPKKIKLFLLNKQLMHDKMDQYIQKYCIRASLSIPVNSLLWLKYPPTANTADRVVILIKHDPPTYWILAFMDEYEPKYTVKHVQCNSETDKWDIKQQLSNGTRILHGGKGTVSESDIELICDQANINASSSYIKFELFAARKEIAYLKRHCKSNSESYKDMIIGQLEKWTIPRNANKWKETLTYITPTAKDKELDKMLTDNGYNLGMCTWNKSKSQQTTSFHYVQLCGIFGDSVSQEIITDHGGHYILSITKMDLVFYPKKRVDNLKIKAYVKKLAPPPPSSDEESD